MCRLLIGRWLQRPPGRAWWDRYRRSTPPPCRPRPAPRCPKQPSMPLNAGRVLGSGVLAAGCPNSRSNTITWQPAARPGPCCARAEPHRLEGLAAAPRVCLADCRPRQAGRGSGRGHARQRIAGEHAQSDAGDLLLTTRHTCLDSGGWTERCACHAGRSRLGPAGHGTRSSGWFTTARVSPHPARLARHQHKEQVARAAEDRAHGVARAAGAHVHAVARDLRAFARQRARGLGG